MKKKLAILMATLALLLVGLAFVGPAPTAATSASTPDCGFIEVAVWTNTYHGGAFTWGCALSYGYFQQGGAGPYNSNNLNNWFGPCADFAAWNDCISSFEIWTPSCRYGVRFSVNQDNGGAGEVRWGPHISRNTALYNDQYSSIVVYYRSSC